MNTADFNLESSVDVEAGLTSLPSSSLRLEVETNEDTHQNSGQSTLQVPNAANKVYRTASAGAADPYDSDVYIHDNELHLAFSRKDNAVTITVVEAKCFQRHTPEHDEIGSLGSTSVDDADVFNDGGFPNRRSVNFDLDQAEQIFFRDETLLEHIFWVDIYIKNPGTNTVSEIHRTCQALAVASPATNGAVNISIIRNEALFRNSYNTAEGVEGYGFRPRWDEPVVLHLDGVTSQSSHRRSSAGSTNSGEGDRLDTLCINSPQLCCILRKDAGIIGEIYFPVKNLMTHEGWYPLMAMDSEHMHRLRRSRGLSSRLGSLLAYSSGQEEMWYRKLFSVRFLFLILVFFQLTLVIVATTWLLYRQSAYELEITSKQLSLQVWLRINADLDAEFYAPEMAVTFMAGVLANPAMSFSALNTVAGFFYSILDETNNFSTEHISVNVSLVYVGYPTNEMIGVGLPLPEDIAPYPSAMWLIKFKPQTSPNITAYWNSNCPPFNSACPIYNMSAPTGFMAPVNVTQRPWFQLVENIAGPWWTDVYQYVTDVYGMTCSYRVPQPVGDSFPPLQAVVSVDVSLQQLDALLESLQYHYSGVGYIVKPENCVIIASSVPSVYDALPERNGSLADIQVPPDLEGVCSMLSAAYLHLQRVTYFTSGCVRYLGNKEEAIALNLIQESAIEVCGALEQGVVFSSSPLSVSLDSGGIAAVGTFDGTNVPLLIVVAIPEQDIVGYIQRMVRVSVYLSILILFVSLIIAIVVANMITRQLIACTKQLKQFASLDFQKKVPIRGINSPFIEIALIYETLSLMRLSLRSFSKYIPADYVRDIVESDKEAELGAKKQEITIFFTDIVDFTTIAERLDLPQLMQILQVYLEEMSQIIQDNEGTIDKYIGDAIMALWNAPTTVHQHPVRACEAALLYQSRLEVLQREWEEQGLPRVDARIGIHTGLALVGNFGSSERLNYTALGDNVNLASRLEGLNKEYGTHVIISETTFKHVKIFFICRVLDVVAVKGKTQPSRVYELVAHRDDATSAQERSVALFNEAFSLYIIRQFKESAGMFEQYLEDFNPTDKAALIHLQACRQYMIQPPSESWTGVRHLTTK